MKNLQKFPNLTGLWLNGTQVTNPGLDALLPLTRLQTLHMYQTKIDDKGLATLAKIPTLRSVYLYGSPVTTAGMDALRKAIPTSRVYSNAK